MIATDIIYLSSGLLNVLLFSFTRPYLLPHDPPTPDAMSVSVSHRDNTFINVIGTSSQCGSPNEGADSDIQRHTWYGFPQTESPVNYSACEGSVRGSGASLSLHHEKLGAKNESLHSLGR